jgi:2-keto-4-pentenoate hydratase/2-oxohepta-3-ene-1,7-dioic acid hydratase in catechol pathway
LPTTKSISGTIKEYIMKLCRYDDDRLGVVRGDLVHDVTEAQTEIRKAAPYAMRGDAVVAALPQWRERIEHMADKAPGKPIAQVKLLSPVARPSKLTCAPTNYQAHINEMQAAIRRSWRTSRRKSSKPACFSNPTRRWSARRKASRCAFPTGATIMRSNW